LSVESAYSEALALHYEAPALLPQQVEAMQWLEISTMALKPESRFERFKHAHEVIMRGGVYFQPITHPWHHERKCAGGKR
jgi:alanine-alpha-ketoisovalerate/valine-pyruvate aminotransferase